MRLIDTIKTVLLAVAKFILCTVLRVHWFKWTGAQKFEKSVLFNEKNKMIRGWNRKRLHYCSLCGALKQTSDYRRIHSDWQNPGRLFSGKAG